MMLFILFVYHNNILTELYVHGGRFLCFTYALLTFISLFILYTPFFYVITSSLSIQTLILIYNTQNKTFNLNMLTHHFANELLIQKRLNIMVKNFYLQEKNGLYFLTTKGKYIAVFFNYIKKIWKLGDGG